MKDGIAIWWNNREDDNNHDTKIELHVNLWVSKERAHYIEFGVKITKPKNIDKINIFLPYQISKTDVEDMAERLATPDLTNALFNENMALSGQSGKELLVTSVNSGDKFHYYFFDDDEIKVNYKKNEGTTVSMELSEETKNLEPVYCRLRINKVDHVHILREYSKNLSFIEGLSKVLVTTELSINTVRKLPRSIVGKLAKKIKLSSINLFLMTDISTEIIFHSKEIQSTRILEDDIWNDYLGMVDKKSKFRCVFPSSVIHKTVAYQWKKPFGDDDKEQEYSLFIKLHRVKKAFTMITLSIITVIVLSVFGNLATKGLNSAYDYLANDNNTTQGVKDENIKK